VADLYFSMARRRFQAQQRDKSITFIELRLGFELGRAG
jgi:hypothetical protein